MKWIKCSERMPDKESYYLTWSNGQYVDPWTRKGSSPLVGWYDKEANDFEEPCCKQWLFAKYWMHLPESPQEKK